MYKNYFTWKIFAWKCKKRYAVHGALVLYKSSAWSICTCFVCTCTLYMCYNFDMLCRTLMSKVSDFQELAKMSKSQLTGILENKTNAEMLWNFLHSDHTHACEPGLGRPEASSSWETFPSKKIRAKTNQGGKGGRQQKKLKSTWPSWAASGCLVGMEIKQQPGKFVIFC